MKEMVYYAYRTVPLYYQLAEQRGLNIEELSYEELPIVNKDLFIEKGCSAISSEYMADYLRGSLLHTRTSGSTGKCSEIYWNTVQEKQSLFSLWVLRKKYYGITPRDKLCYFYPADNGTEKMVREERRLAISKHLIVREKMQEIFEYMLDFQPVWLILQPSIAAILCQYAFMIPEKIIQNMKYIELTGEYLSHSLKKKIESVFYCKVANQYGSKEFNSIAYECPEGNLHVMSDNVYVEILGGEQGDICVTTFKNKVMPLIRFNMEDKGSLCISHECSCGNPNPILKLIDGRSNDFIKRKDRKRIHAYALLSVFHDINMMTDGGILQYQIFQKKLEYFEIHLVLEETEMQGEIIQLLSISIQEILGEVELVFLIHSCLIPNKKTGKLACFICEC